MRLRIRQWAALRCRQEAEEGWSAVALCQVVHYPWFQLTVGFAHLHTADKKRQDKRAAEGGKEALTFENLMNSPWKVRHFNYNSLKLMLH